MRDGIVWVHLSDRHQSQPGETYEWDAVRGPLLADMKRLAGEVGPPDLVLFTGDLAFGGREPQYDEVDAVLHEVREAVGGDPLLVPVPGHHDLNRDPVGTVLRSALTRYFMCSAQKTHQGSPCPGRRRASTCPCTGTEKHLPWVASIMAQAG